MTFLDDVEKAEDDAISEISQVRIFASWRNVLLGSQNPKKLHPVYQHILCGINLFVLGS